MNVIDAINSGRPFKRPLHFSYGNKRPASIVE